MTASVLADHGPLDDSATIAAWLHDDIGQLLARARLDLAQLDSAVHDGADCARVVRSVDGLIEAAVRALRARTYQLRNPGARRDLVRVLAESSEWVATGSRLRCGFESNVSSLELDARCVDHLGLAVRELLLNVVAHAGASACCVRLAVGSDAIVVEVSDDGLGVLRSRGSAPGAGGSGLAIVRERLASLGGSMRITWHGGCRVIVTLPLERQLPAAG